MPAWLRERIVKPKPDVSRKPPVRISAGSALVRDGAALGSRNDDLTRLTGHLLSRDVNAVLVLELVRLVNSRSSPPLPDDEVTRIVESIAGRELRKRTGGRP